MQLILLDNDRPPRPVGAVVIRPTPDGGVVVDLGPADGAPLARLVLGHSEAMRLSDVVKSVAEDRREAVILTDEDDRH
jgi:hypothetical protein